MSAALFSRLRAMRATRLPDGRLRIPVAVQGRGDTIGDTTEDIGPDDPRFAEWEPWVTDGSPDGTLNA